MSTVESGAFKGLVILFVSFFAMPFKTLKITLQQLREVAGKGKLDVGTTDIPHLNWLLVAGHFVASVVVVVIVVIGALKGLGSLGDIRYSPKSALGGFLLYPLGGILIAVIADWIITAGIELLGLWTGMANDIRKISQR